MSDHGDHAVGEHDLTDLYVFRKPGDPAKTILVMGMNPDVVPGVPPPQAQPFDPDARYDFMIDADGDAVPDSAFRITFPPTMPDARRGQCAALPVAMWPAPAEMGQPSSAMLPCPQLPDRSSRPEEESPFSPVAGAIRFSRTWWADGTTTSGRGRISWRATMYPRSSLNCLPVILVHTLRWEYGHGYAFRMVKESSSRRTGPGARSPTSYSIAATKRPRTCSIRASRPGTAASSLKVCLIPSRHRPVLRG